MNFLLLLPTEGQTKQDVAGAESKRIKRLYGVPPPFVPQLYLGFPRVPLSTNVHVNDVVSYVWILLHEFVKFRYS